jgi:hypothetical protein
MKRVKIYGTDKNDSGDRGSAFEGRAGYRKTYKPAGRRFNWAAC